MDGLLRFTGIQYHEHALNIVLPQLQILMEVCAESKDRTHEANEFVTDFLITSTLLTTNGRGLGRTKFGYVVLTSLSTNF